MLRAQGGLNRAGKGLEGGELEERAQGQLDTEGVADPREDLGRQQGVAAELEEVVLSADLVHLEQLAPRLGQGLLQRGAGRNEVPPFWGQDLKAGEGLAVELAIGRERQGVEQDEGRGNHVVRELFPEEASQLRRGEGALPGGDDVGDEALVSRDFFVGEHRGLLHSGLGQEDGLDLSQLDAEATELDLVVDAAEVLQVPIRQQAGEVASPIEAAPGLGAEGIREESLGGELWAVEIAASEARAGEMKLARNTAGNGVEVSIQQIGPGAGDGATDGGLR